MMKLRLILLRFNKEENSCELLDKYSNFKWNCLKLGKIIKVSYVF